MSAEPLIAELIGRADGVFTQAAFCTGDFTEVRALLQAAYERAARGDEPALRAAAATRLALAQHYAAIALFRRALEIVERDGDAVDLYTRSEVHRHVGFYHLVEAVSLDDAVHHLERSLALRAEMADPRVMPSALVALGEAELERGRADRAVALLQDADRIAHEAGLLPVWIEHGGAALARARDAAAERPDAG